MNNTAMGKIGTILTGISVFAFALSMLLGSIFASCLSSIFIAIGFIFFMVSIAAVNKDPEKKAIGLTGLAFSAIYAVIIFLVYYAECTTVRMNGTLSEEALSIISYGHAGSLFFNYDQLGYGFMGLSTFLIAFTIIPQTKGDRALRMLMWIHGIFFPFCLIFPLFPLFTENNAGSDLMGVLILEFWCLYFLPICILGYRYFAKEKRS